MTVKDLRDHMAGLPDDMEITIRLARGHDDREGIDLYSHEGDFRVSAEYVGGPPEFFLVVGLS